MNTSIARLALAAAIISFAVAQPVSAMDSEKVQKGAADLTKARALIKAKNWKPATTELKRLEAMGPNADVYNLLGFSLRKQGQFDISHTYYMKALKLDPNHKHAREYLGELYLQKGQLAKAKEQASILAKLCPKGCEERADLDKAIAAYKP